MLPLFGQNAKNPTRVCHFKLKCHDAPSEKWTWGENARMPNVSANWKKQVETPLKKAVIEARVLALAAMSSSTKNDLLQARDPKGFIVQANYYVLGMWHKSCKT